MAQWGGNAWEGRSHTSFLALHPCLQISSLAKNALLRTNDEFPQSYVLNSHAIRLNLRSTLSHYLLMELRF